MVEDKYLSTWRIEQLSEMGDVVRVERVDLEEFEGTVMKDIEAIDTSVWIFDKRTEKAIEINLLDVKRWGFVN